METVNSFCKKALSWMFDWVLNTPLASLGCVRYLAVSIITATLASCAQVVLEISFFVHFWYVYVCFVKSKTKFREIIHSWQINEITCLNERILFSYTLFIGYFFRFSINSIKALIRMTIMEIAVE